MTKATKFHFSVLDQKNAKSNKGGREKKHFEKKHTLSLFLKKLMLATK